MSTFTASKCYVAISSFHIPPHVELIELNEDIRRQALTVIALGLRQNRKCRGETGERGRTAGNRDQRERESES